MHPGRVYVGSYCFLPSRHGTLRQAAADTFLPRFRFLVGNTLNMAREQPVCRGLPLVERISARTTTAAGGIVEDEPGTVQLIDVVQGRLGEIRSAGSVHHHGQLRT